MDLDRITQRRGTDSFKWDDTERLFGRSDLMPFWVADMDFETPKPILDAIRQRCRHSILGYGIRSQEYYQAITDWLRIRHDWVVPVEWLMFCPPSSIVGIHGLVTGLTDAGSSILLHTPIYGPLMNIVRDNDRHLIECALVEQGGKFGIDADATVSQLREDTQMIMLCNPHNPTGRVFSSTELMSVVQLAEERDLLLVSDEVHCDLVMPGQRHIPLGKIAGERSITVISPNKAFNTAGLPQATLIIPDAAIRRKFASYLDTMQLNHDSTFGAVGMIAAYTKCSEWLDQVILYVSENHRFVATWLEMNLPVVRKATADATYLAWLDFRATGLNEEELSKRLVEIGGVGLYPGSIFGAAGTGFFRMNLACPRSQLEKGLQGIRTALVKV
ncbi:MAG: pyridoxal phosphate-dependent aminotransferase [Gammaproteobacteria bacterium]|nr:pyridoxal phosphate-dependent aminotransferase [Gammaproteobacteria bacterium]MDH5214234.1 pyridoxal phosphate-dependent aminotransferase [Gammaproteobacteria bacterium]